MRVVASVFFFLVALAFALSPVFFLASCSPSPEAKRAEAATSYAGQQADCIKANRTRETIDACRDRVKAEWSKDAGAEGGAR